MKWRTLQPTSYSSWCVSHVLGAVHHWLVTYWDPCKTGSVHILKSSEVLKQSKVSTVSSSTGIVESRDKSFALDLKLLFIIVDCFSGRFPPWFFYCETSLFHWFSLVIISCLILLFCYAWYWHDIDVSFF